MRRPVNRFVLAAALIATSACEDVIGVEAGGDRFRDEVFRFSVENNIQFGSAVGTLGVMEPLRLDLYQPRNDPDGLRPAVVWLHGGGLTHGHKGEMTEYARRFAQRGYVSVSIEYRLFDLDFDYRNPHDPIADIARRAAQHDAQAAVRWLRANASALRLDPARIAVAGYSAGGTTALRVAFRPHDVGGSGNAGQPSDVAAAIVISGSPTNNTTSGATLPLLLIHGDVDRKVAHQDVSTACSDMPGCQLITISPGDHALLSAARERIIAEAATFLFERVVAR